jgi:hypothetical protein
VLGRIQVNGITEAKAIRSIEAVIAIASQVEHADVDPDVRLLLLSQSSRYKRQGGMEAPPNRGVSGVLE